MSSMDSAPMDGSIIEILLDGEWIESFWSERAHDGSPYGTEGWAQVDGNYLILDGEAWRPTDALCYGEASPLQGHNLRQPVIVLGLGFGDEAKGATVDYLASAIPDATAVVRWSGGANAAHNVRHGHRHHTFRQFGSGTFLRLPTFLTERTVLNLQILMAEAVELEGKGVHDPLSLVVLHSDSLVTTPIHIALNRAREILRGSKRHGSVGLGIGETVAHGYAERNGLTVGESVGNFELPGSTAKGRGVLTAGSLVQHASEDVQSRVVEILREQSAYAEPMIREAMAAVPELADELWYGSLSAMAEELIEIANSVDVFPARAFERELEATMARGTVIFEGSQGLLLDEQWGFHPHTTWAQIEPSTLVDWLYELGHRPYILGLTRSYMTRHGAGPLPSERALELSDRYLPADDNSWGRWQGGFRVAPLDLPLLQYSLQILAEEGLKLNGLSVSHLDAFSLEVPAVMSYRGRPIPSRMWSFESDGASDFPRRNSDVFLRDRVLDEKPDLVSYSPEEFPEKLGNALRVSTVLVARGPRRIDRELLGSSPSEKES